MGEMKGVISVHMRKKKWSRPELAACAYYVQEPEEKKGSWADLFPKRQPLHLELGCGKGVSTAKMAHDNLDVNYIAIDINADVMGCTRRNVEKAYGQDPVENILLTNCHIEYIHTMLDERDPIERIYINFCNPWSSRPKHHKRRLTHPRQLIQYRRFLKEGGEIWFKTDDKLLFNDSLVYFDACGFERVYVTDDLHSSGFTPNYVSEHEQKYTAQGMKIHFGIFRRLPGDLELDAVTWRLWDGLMEEDEDVREGFIVKRIVEDDFGCEGLPEGEELQVTILLIDDEGQLRRVRMADSLAYARGIQEGCRVTLAADGTLELTK